MYVNGSLVGSAMRGGKRLTAISRREVVALVCRLARVEGEVGSAPRRSVWLASSPKKRNPRDASPPKKRNPRDIKVYRICPDAPHPRLLGLSA
jgi:hypothetical protein